MTVRLKTTMRMAMTNTNAPLMAKAASKTMNTTMRMALTYVIALAITMVAMTRMAMMMLMQMMLKMRSTKMSKHLVMIWMITFWK